jgi:excisionase family DNA binding protein
MEDIKLTLTATEAAQMLGICRSGVYEGIRRGEIPHCRVGKRLLIPRCGLEAMFNGALTTAPNPQRNEDENDGG